MEEKRPPTRQMQILLNDPIFCGECSALIVMSEEQRAQRLADHKPFFCVNGHSRTWPAKTEADALREALAKLESEYLFNDIALSGERHAVAGYQRSLAACRRENAKLRAELKLAKVGITAKRKGAAK